MTDPILQTAPRTLGESSSAGILPYRDPRAALIWESGLAISLVLGLVQALVLTLIVGLSAGDARAADPEMDVLVPSGFRCETRHRAREVVRRQFVLDRTTECRPLLARAPVRSPNLQRSMHRSVALRAESTVDASPGPTLTPPSGDVAKWSVDRRRLGNAQYDRSLRAMRGSLSRTAR